MASARSPSSSGARDSHAGRRHTTRAQIYNEAEWFYDDVVGESAVTLGTLDHAAGLSSFVQAVQKVFEYKPIDAPEAFLEDADDYELVRAHMRSGVLLGRTVWGDVRFDAFGQNVRALARARLACEPR